MDVLAAFLKSVGERGRDDRRWRASVARVGRSRPRRSALAGLVNVYPRCEPVLTEPTEEEYSATGVLGPTDRKASNVGWLKGRLVWIDYDMSWNDCRCRKE